MKHIQIIIVMLFVVLISVTSCEKVIDIKTNNSTPQLVIEGNISDAAGPYYVKLSTSINYDQSNVFPAVQNAVVTIKDNSGHSETLTEISPGNYKTNTLQGNPGNTYTLYVKTTDKKEYTATSTMPVNAVNGSAGIERASFSFNKEDTLEVAVQFTDPPGLGDSYRFIQYINNKQSEAINVTTDKYFDGNTTKMTLYRKDKEYIKKGDNIIVKMRTIDKAAYDYFNTLDGIINNRGNASPANPVSTITGGALGYFCAYRETSQAFVVQ